MQTNDKKDYRTEIHALNKRLQAYRAEYRREAERVVKEFLSDLSLVTNNEDGYYYLSLDRQIEKCVDPKFPDLKELQNPFNRTAPKVLMGIYRDFWHSQIKPINYSVDEQIGRHWKKVWRAEWVDFGAIPPAPPRRYDHRNTEFTTISRNNEYQFGQMTVKIEGGKKFRYIVLCVKEVRLWAKNAQDINIKECLTFALPLAQRLDRVCDWSQVSQLSTAGLNALRLRTNLIFSYYTKEYDKQLGCMVPSSEYRNRLRELAMYGREEDLERKLAEEKAHHALRPR